MLRVVLDTHVVVSSLLSPLGPSARIMTAWRQFKMTLVSSQAILEEVGGVLNYPRIRAKYQIDDKDIDRLLNLLKKYAILAAGKGKVPGALPDDPEDEKFLECALEGQADVIVSGGHHLLTLKTFHGISIITARQFVEQYLS